MTMITTAGGSAFDISRTPAHLAPGGRAGVVEGFSWERVDEYAAATASDGPDGRMVMVFQMSGPWSHWECHPAGDEVLIACSGTHHFLQEIDGVVREVTLRPHEALINPAGVWHTGDSGSEGGWIVAITPGEGTDHRPR